MIQIPLVDLQAQFNSIKPEIYRAIDNVFSSGQFIQGSFVSAFEESFGAKQGAMFVAGCANGTAAITLALRTLGIGSGDQVITTPHTFIGTVEPILEVGATPIFVDIDPTTYNLDPKLIESAITNKTKAIIPVHLYGNPANMVAIKKIADQYNLKIIEDCAQAHLAEHQGQFVGTLGDLATFSFYPGKNLGAYGDAGAIISRDVNLIKHCRTLANHGRSNKYLHDVPGYNLRMDDLQAAFLSVKLNYISQWTDRRREVATLYNQLLQEHPQIQCPIEIANDKHVYHLYVIKLQHTNRDAVLSQLHKKSIMAGIHYPTPLHLQPALVQLGYKKGSFPISEEAAANIISLPIFPELTNEQIYYICNTLINCLNDNTV